MTNRYLRNIIMTWERWRLHRAMPELAAAHRERIDARRRHRSTKRIEAEARRIMTARLASEMAR
jgi:hypothetical protein